jgi:zinc transporter ZupT
MAEKPREAPELDPEKVALLIATLDRLRRKQRLLIVGYLGALVLLIGGLAAAFALYAAMPENRFRSLFFFLPLGLTGALLWIIGRLSRSKGRSDPPAGSYKKP